MAQAVEETKMLDLHKRSALLLDHKYSTVFESQSLSLSHSLSFLWSYSVASDGLDHYENRLASDSWQSSCLNQCQHYRPKPQCLVEFIFL